MTLILPDETETHITKVKIQKFIKLGAKEVILDMKFIIGRDKNIEEIQNVSVNLNLKLLESIILYYLFILG